ncbi:uncharacterized protein BDW43DRAFT_120456 [Aspergillus alliaceus]|uniref:uncharacterized protein n=1 Tax=Petromyces alliaceus TaxID=209559 RepID=UPI0012A51BCB|nr:uncharacterized protein BDW43DRAFT_120456 [Aspergillus alliaceus]KAB8238622.1 hypothetical protein BDW43DRAFT_120456 [Aspergillus alliaceus]
MRHITPDIDPTILKTRSMPWTTMIWVDFARMGDDDDGFYLFTSCVFFSTSEYIFFFSLIDWCRVVLCLIISVGVGVGASVVVTPDFSMKRPFLRCCMLHDICVWVVRGSEFAMYYRCRVDVRNGISGKISLPFCLVVVPGPG